MTNLIQNVKEDFKEFWDLPIIQNGVIYRKTAYDSVHTSLLLERLSESGKDDDLVIVSPDDPTFTLLIIIESLLSLLKYDMLNSNPQILLDVKEGDPVALMQNATRKMLPGTYMGTERNNGIIKFYCVKTRDGVLNKIPPTRSKWRIQPYSTISSSHRKLSTTIFGKALEDLAGLPPGGLMAVQRSKALLVMPGIDRIVKAIRGVTLGGDSIEAIFPMARYSDIQKLHSIGNNPLQRAALLGIVANVDLAVDIALKDPSIKLVIIEGASKIRSQYGSIERLNNDSEPRKIICLLKSNDEEEIKTLSSINIDTWIWKRQDFQNIEQQEDNNTLDKDNIFHLHNRVLNCLSGPEAKTLIVDSQLDFEYLIEQSIKCARIITRQIDAQDPMNLMLRWAISLINTMLQLPIPLENYYSYLELVGDSEHLRIDYKLKAFQEKLQDTYGLTISLSTKSIFEKLIDQLWKIYKILELHNSKADTLQKLLNDYQGKPVTVIGCKPEYSNALKFAMDTYQNVQILSINNKNTLPIENVIMTGWFSRKMAAKLFLAPYKNLIYILYPYEDRSYSQTLRSHLASPKSNMDNKLRKEQGLEIEQLHEAIVDGDIIAIDELIDRVRSKFNAFYNDEHMQDYSTSEMIQARRLLFDNDSYIYLTENDHLHKLERNNNKSHRCKLSEVVSGDELIFAESEKDIFDELLVIIKQSVSYQSLFKEGQLWHSKLKEYLGKNNLNEDQLGDQLALVGCEPTRITVRSWVDGSLISPSESNLRALAKVIDDFEFNEKLENVIRAGSKIRALHVQTGRLLVRRIIDAVTQEDDEILNDETKARVEEYSQRARVVTVVEISDDVVSIPARAIGRFFGLDI